MRRIVPALTVLLLTSPLHATGLLIPEEKSLPPLAMHSHKVSVTIDDQVSVTRVEQVFRNHTTRVLEATYVFPVPRGASVNRFTMWVDGKEVKGEMVEAQKAREIYNSIVKRTQDPGLLEYIGQDLLRVRVFPVPAQGDQKLSVSFTSVAQREGGLVEYVYPLKTDGKATQVLEDFSVNATITSAHGVENVYSPTHAITLARKTDKQVEIGFNRKGGLLDRDFQLFYQLGSREVGLTALTHRPVAAEDGSFLLLVTPQLKLSKDQQVPRDLVLVMDTSGSMAGAKMEQARKALKYCLERLNPGDRFGIVNFATVVNKYRDNLIEGTAEQVADAKRWVDELEATGGTNIHDALVAALDMRPKDEGRSFTIAFFTDGQPTVGETNPEKILEAVLKRNTANTRIFAFGVGDDVNATLLDRLADKTRAWANYVRPAEDIELKVSNLHTKIAHPVMTNLKLATTGDVRLKEMYPPVLPDLFSGSQLIVLGRYTGKGPAAIKLTGQVGKAEKELVYELTFPEKTGDERQLVEHLWARRKVGYLLNEIRVNGEQKELVDEVTKLARRHGIATPYTSYLLVPDGTPTPAAKSKPKPAPGVPDVRFGPGGPGGGQFGQFGQVGFPGGQMMGMNMMGMNFMGMNMMGGGVGLPRAGGVPMRGQLGAGGIMGGTPPMGQMGMGGGQFGALGAFGNLGGQFGIKGAPGVPPGTTAKTPDASTNWRSAVNPTGSTQPREPARESKAEPTKVLDFARILRQAGYDGDKFVPLAEEGDRKSQEEAQKRLDTYLKAREALAKGQQSAVQTGQLGVDLSLEVDRLRRQGLVDGSTQKKAAGREFQLLAGIWIDRGFKEKTPAVVVKAMSDAYFRILERVPEARDVFRLGNRVIWMTPGGTALVIDESDGKEKLDDKEIDQLFAKK